LVNKYVPIALNNLYKNMVMEGGNEQDKADIAEMKIKMKYEKDLDVIDEDEYGNEILSDDEEEEQE
jgi:hypothetical protein